MVYSITKENWKDSGRDYFYHEAHYSAKKVSVSRKTKTELRGEEKKDRKKTHKSICDSRSRYFLKPTCTAICPMRLCCFNSDESERGE